MLSKNLPNKLIIFFINKSLRLVNLVLHYLEGLSSYTDETPLLYPPIFIIGAPRSGSTLLYQVLTNYYDVGYLSNLHARFYGSPSIIERFFHPLKSRQSCDYNSYHGRTEGWLAPSECGELWYRFFRRKPPYIPLDEADPEKIRQLRRSVRSLGDAFGKPILFKNLYCSLRLRPIAEALPESLFIVIHRNPVDHGHSLLKARKKVHGNYKIWWSAEPPEIDQLKTLPPHQQVIEQIRHIYSLIETDKQVIGSERFLDLYYEDFCKNTHESIKQIDSFLNGHGIAIHQHIDISKIPASFNINKTVNINSNIYSKMVDYVQAKSIAKI